MPDPISRRREEEAMKAAGRLPPGQSLTQKFPVLHYGVVPGFAPQTWDLRVFGEVKREMRWTWDEFLALPTVTLQTDIHCVTRWSMFDTVWEGVRVRDFVELFGLTPEVRFVIAHCENDYTTNVPLDIMLEENVLLAYKFGGEFLTPDHGFPLRTLIPSRYFWKSAKWLRALEFTREDRPGFWEQAGYHNEGDPWKEERLKQGSMF